MIQRDVYLLPPKSDFRCGIDFFVFIQFSAFWIFTVYTNYSLDWELLQKQKKNKQTHKASGSVPHWNNYKTALIAP